MTSEAFLDTLRLARDMGGMEQVLPEGVTALDMPHNIFEALRYGSIFVGFDELPADERPPKRIWLDGDALNEWFDDVRRGRARTEPDIEDPVENEAARDLIVG